MHGVSKKLGELSSDHPNGGVSGCVGWWKKNMKRLARSGQMGKVGGASSWTPDGSWFGLEILRVYCNKCFWTYMWTVVGGSSSAPKSLIARPTTLVSVSSPRWKGAWLHYCCICRVAITCPASVHLIATERSSVQGRPCRHVPRKKKISSRGWNAVDPSRALFSSPQNSKEFKDSSSDRILRYMYRTLSINKNN
jgi:hypothetical protein